VPQNSVFHVKRFNVNVLLRMDEVKNVIFKVENLIASV